MDYVKQLMGLAFLAWPLTLLILVGLAFLIVIPLAIRFAKRTGRSRWRWGIAGFLVVFLPIFWDWIPTVVTHKYYCSTEAGFWVYKTVDEWRDENPGVMETLVYERSMPHIQTPFGKATVLNDRFLHVFKHEGPFMFNLWKVEKEIRDSKNGELIAREVDFYTSQERRKAGWSGWKFWLASDHCSIEKHRDRGSFSQITSNVEGGNK